ncbi:hypothetical protein [Pyxidicoccus trucidator]|uniref:hypothetical protein n=1 Tax=Pyxidicoccus trucidator TaxID=2709662 RepID=UPI0013DA0FF6|nr:hypothetical protein [Pyxidicoccus trucidator]
MLRWALVLGMLAVAGCNDSEVRTYRLAPYLEPGKANCNECSIQLTLVGVEDGKDLSTTRNFSPGAFAKGGFTFRWGVEQLVEVKVVQYDTGGMEDAPSVGYHFMRVLETHPVEPGGRFEMRFWDAPPGVYADDLLVRTPEGFNLGPGEVIECESEALCEQLAEKTLGEDAFALELSYPDAEIGRLLLHSLRELSRP